MQTDKNAAILLAFVDLIREERERQGLTYEDMAAASGLHRTTVGLYERSERGPTIEAALQIADALGVSLSELLRKAEEGVYRRFVKESFRKRREVSVDNFTKGDVLRKAAGLSLGCLRQAMLETYRTLDTIDYQLQAHGVDPLARLVELANLSSMIGNLLAAGLADASNGLYKRNRPHAYPDLIPQTKRYDPLELKIALETNKPKGHLPKPGMYITFRYVLCDRSGTFQKGKAMRGDCVFIWEVKVGHLDVEDFALSSTKGDSGKTAVIKTDVFNAMPLIYFDSELNPYSTHSGEYPGFN